MALTPSPPVAADMIRRSVVWDNHGCMPLRADDAFLPQLEMVAVYHDLGVRWMLMATAFGREVLAEMSRVGIVPCCSHSSWETARDVLDAVAGPMISRTRTPTPSIPTRETFPTTSPGPAPGAAA